MCSAQQQEDLENMPSLLESKPAKAKGEIRGRRTCMKCSSSEAVVVVRMDDPLCKTCFLAYFTHKFRATIGKARAIRAGEKVLLAFSGGPSSSAMLHLVCEGLSFRVPKKLRFEPGIAFIDEGEILKSSKEERLQYAGQIREIASKTGFPFHQLNLEDVLGLEKSTQGDAIGRKKSGKLETGKDDAGKLKSLFDATVSMTAKEDLLRILRHQLLLATARKEGYSKVMFAECATRISIRLLSDISQGRGGDLPYDTGFCDNRHGDVIFIRPMREFMSKEIALYNFFNNVETVQIMTLGTMTHSHASIDRLTEEFVSGLQADFPFTVSTIFRTGDKLSVKESDDDVAPCALCGVPMTLDPTPLSTLSDTLHRVELDVKSTPLSESGCCGGCDSQCSSSLSDQQLTKEDVLQALCYGCQLTFKDTKLDLDNLPAYVVETVNRVQQRAQMKEHIKEFLLED